MYHQRFKSPDERFNEKYVVNPKTGCWDWITGDSEEYPKFWNEGGYIRASRFSYQRASGARLRPEQCVCHSCDNPSCVNPGHLFIGNHLENMRDKAAKKRASRLPGTANGRAKLDEGTVTAIREEYAKGGVSQWELARRYSIGQSTISRVIRQQAWG
jgi:hypothetical protein